MAKRNYLNNPTKQQIGRSINGKKIKRINREREKVGLPPMTLNKKTQNNTDPTSTQWNAFASASWNYIKNFYVISASTSYNIGNSVSTRNALKIKFYPFEVQWPVYQIESTQHVYRILVIKLFDNVDADNLEPQDILEDTTSALAACYSNYLQLEERDTFGGSAVDRLHFKILQDKRFVWNTTAGAPGSAQYRTLKTRIPAAKINYDESDTDGGLGENMIVVCFITTATAASASFTHGMNYHQKWLDTF